MGLGGISIWQLLIILVIVIMLFGTKKLRNIGGDLGTAVKGFRNSIKDDDADKSDEADPAITEQDSDAETVSSAKAEQTEK